MLSGKFVLRVDPNLHKKLKEEAESEGQSLNSLCLKKLQQDLTPHHSEALGLIIQEYHPLGIILFGSAARGETRESSDIDLLIVLEPSTQISRSLYQRWDRVLNANTKYSPQFVHLTPVDTPVGSIWLESSLEGEILYDNNNIVKNEMIRIRGLIAEGQFQRKSSHGHAYWIRRESDAK